MSTPRANFNTYRLNTYQNPEQTRALTEKGIPFNKDQETIFYFDIVKLSLYTLYFGTGFLSDLNHVRKLNLINGTPGQYFNMVWNVLVNFCNITNTVNFIQLSFFCGYVNDMLRNDVFIDSYKLANIYATGQRFDTFLILMNLLMLIRYTKVSRRVSLIFGLISKTTPYLGFLVMTYIVLLVLMALIVW